MKTIDYQVDGMNCANCVRTESRSIAELGARGKADLATGHVPVTYERPTLNFELIRAAIEEGYQVRSN